MRLERIIGMIVFILLLILLIISSWLSVESILLSWECLSPFKWLLYWLTIPIYLIAANCLRCIIVSINIDAFDGFVMNARRQFTLGLLGWIVLWLFFIIPTKAHTLFYKFATVIAYQETTGIEEYNNTCILNNIEQLDRLENVWFVWQNLFKGQFEEIGYVMWCGISLSVVIDAILFAIFLYPTIQTIRIHRRWSQY